MGIKSANPKRYVVTVNGKRITGATESDIVSIKLDEDLFKKYIGADGTASRIQNPSSAGTITISLAQTSPDNTYLSGLSTADTLIGDGSGTAIVTVTDSNSQGTTFVAKDSWIKNMPDYDLGADMASVVWEFDSPEIIWVITGSGQSLVSKLINDFVNVLN